MSQEKPMSCIFSLGVWHLLHLKSRVHRAAVVSRDRKAQILRFCKHRTLWKSKVKDGRHAANDTCRTSNNMFKKHDYKFIVIQYGETWRKRVNLYITPPKIVLCMLQRVVFFNMCIHTVPLSLPHSLKIEFSSGTVFDFKTLRFT